MLNRTTRRVILPLATVLILLTPVYLTGCGANMGSDSGATPQTLSGVGNAPVQRAAPVERAASLAPSLLDPGSFVATGSMTTARYFHVATALLNGKVLVAGGGSPAGLVSSAELYDPQTATWSQTGSMTATRFAPTATLLTDGRVLIAGGSTVDGPTPLSSAELYDPSTGTFSLTGSMQAARSNFVATVLANGQVLITGGHDNTGSPISGAEVYDPATQMFTSVGNLTMPRADHYAATLPNGQVLVCGGQTSGNAATATAELFDPGTRLFSSTTSSLTGGFVNEGVNAAPLLSDGKLLFVDGSGTSLADLYDPATGMFTATGSMGASFQGEELAVLHSGQVLVAGGNGTDRLPSAAAELYDPTSRTFSAAGSMTTTRDGFGMSVLPSGAVLIDGGFDHSLTILSSAELYRPADTTPPVISGPTATPSSLWPPNNKMVAVQVSGTISDVDDSAAQLTASYSVVDSYGQVQPSGPVTVNANGTFSVSIPLLASRLGSDRNGRTYTITISAQDPAGNNTTASVIVTVPHDQGKNQAEMQHS